MYSPYDKLKSVSCHKLATFCITHPVYIYIYTALCMNVCLIASVCV